MKNDFTNALIEATDNVLKSMISQDIVINDPYVFDPSTEENLIGVCIGVVGKIRGQVFFVMNKEVACFIATKMIMMPVDEINDISRSAISELCNMIVGNVGSLLFNNGIEIDITTPSFIYGENLKFTSIREVKKIHMPFEIDKQYSFNIEILVTNI